MKQTDFTKGETLTYTGRGFIGFSKNNREVGFIQYEGVSDAWVHYDGFNVLVSKYELERPKKK